jgi:hypothetical protein
MAQLNNAIKNKAAVHGAAASADIIHILLILDVITK